MAGCPILFSMASLTFLFNQMSSLTSILTLSLVILWCSCGECSPTAVSVLPVSPMYVRGHSGHSTWYTRVTEAIKIKIGQPAMNRDQGYELPPIYDELLLSCDVIVVKAITWPRRVRHLGLKKDA